MRFCVPRHHFRHQNYRLRVRIVVTGEEADHYVAYEYGVNGEIERIPFFVIVEVKCEKDRREQQGRYDEQRHSEFPKDSVH